MAQKLKFVFFKTVPNNLAYFPNDLARVSAEKAAEYIHDGYALDAEKVADPDIYFNPKSVSKLKDEQLPEFIDSKEKEIRALIEESTEITRKTNHLEKLIKSLTDQRTGEKSAYKKMNLGKEITSHSAALEKVEERLTEIYPVIKQKKIELLNAKVRLYETTLKKFVDDPLLAEGKEKARELLKVNDAIIKRFSKITENISLPFLSNQPYLYGNQLAAINRVYTDVEDTLDYIRKKVTEGFRSQLTQMYKDHVLDELKKVE